MSKASISMFKTCYDHTAGRVRYLYGSKPTLGADSSTFTTADCSGWVRWCLDRAGLRLPDGSATQNEWCAQQGFHKLAKFSDVEFAAHDPHRLFIGFKRPQGGIGHVVLVYMGRTYECSSGKGVNSQPWQNRRNIITDCYELPAVP